ncbi:unnamed protein product, partial [Callosobruchus maculatus]
MILCNVFKTMRPRCLLKCGLPDTFQVLHDEKLPHVEEEMYKSLTRCNQHLLVVFKIRDDLEDIFGVIFLFQSVFSMLIIASNLFVASKVPITSTEFLSQMQ